MKHPEWNCILRWQEKGEEEESTKPMVFWMNEIDGKIRDSSF